MIGTFSQLLIQCFQFIIRFISIPKVGKNIYQFKIHDVFFMFQYKEDISRFFLVTSFMASLLQVSIQMFLGRDNQKELSVQGHPDGGETMYIISKDFGHSLPQLLHFLQNR